MNGIYPDYVGPTIEYRYVSRFPDWVGFLTTVIIPPVATIAGGVIVIPNPYSVEAITRVAAQVLPIQGGVGMVQSILAATVRVGRVSIEQITQKLGFSDAGRPGVEVDDEDEGV